MQPNCKNNIITVYLSSDYTPTSDGKTTVPLDKVYSQIGTNLSLNNEKIVIGKGINYVLVSGNISFQTAGGTGAKNLYINKNNVEILRSMNSTKETGNNDSRALAPKLIPVTEGDYFTMSYYGKANDIVFNNAARTYITVQAVE